MKRANHLIERISDPDNLRLACWKAAKGKRHAFEILQYAENMDENLLLLREQILTGKVDVGNYRYFKIYEPKERQICASAFREQVLHHALMNVCHEHFERVLIFDSYASRPGKGVHAALRRAQDFTRWNAWFLKLDVKKFFDSVHHETLKSQLARMFKDDSLLDIFGQIIDSYQTTPGRGLPIGNLSSQYFANHFLAGLDHYIKEQLGIKAYVRYMDDMVLWHKDREVLRAARRSIAAYMEESLCCVLKPPLLNKTTRGLPFLGYLLFPNKTRLLRQSQLRFIRKIEYIEEQYHSGDWSVARCRRHALPLLAFLQHADAKRFQKKIILE
jgi:retron-type reverse transcriptase